MRTAVKTTGLVIALAGSCVLAGCGGGQSIHVKGVDKICMQNVRVDVVGVARGERRVWEDLSMQQYWSEGNDLRPKSIAKGYAVAKTFTPGGTCEFTITSKDPVWKSWKREGAAYFLVMFDTCSNDKDWRVSLPLSTKCWRSRRIDITVAPNGVEPQTRQKKCKE
jgi:hypothetical protein